MIQQKRNKDMKIQSYRLLIVAFIISVLHVNFVFAQKKPTYSIIKLWGELDKYSNLLEDANSNIGNQNKRVNSFENKLNYLNKEIVKSISENYQYFDSIDNLEITSKTDIRISKTRDKKLYFYSWDTGLDNRIPNYNNLLCYNLNGKKNVIQYSGFFNGKQVGENLAIDSIYNVIINNKVFYLIARSNKCSIGTCVYCTLTACEIVGDSLIYNVKLFHDSSICTDKLQFEYYINTYIENDLRFEVDEIKKCVYLPLFDLDKTKIIGRKQYSIILCN